MIRRITFGAYSKPSSLKLFWLLFLFLCEFDGAVLGCWPDTGVLQVSRMQMVLLQILLIPRCVQTDSDSDGAKSNLFSSDQTCRWCILSVTALWISLFWKISYLFYLRIHRWKMTRSRDVLVIGWDDLSNFMFTFRFFCTCLLLECSNFVIVLLLLIAEGWLGLDLYFFSSWQRDGLFFFRYNLLLKCFKC